MFCDRISKLQSLWEMMSQQQNPPAVPRSLLQEADVKPFSIREYALASRDRNIIQSWPFPEKYLHMCLNRGIRDVLPPFGQQTSSLKCCSSLIQLQDDDNSSKGGVDELCKTEEATKHTQQVNIKNEIRARIKVTNNNSSSYHHEEEGNNNNNQHNCSVSVSNNNVADHHALISCPTSSILHVCKNTRNPTTLAVKSSDKTRRRRRRGNRCKKRSMVDILAVARHCTPEEIIRMNKFFYNTTDHTNIEGCHQKMELNSGDDDTDEEDYSCRKKSGIGGRREEDHDEVANIGSLIVKFKVNGCNVVNHNCREYE